MAKKYYSLAGWISITKAALELPMAFLIVFSAFYEGVGSEVIPNLLSIISTGLMAYMYLSFKELLNNRFKFYEVNTFIDLMIVGNIILVLISMFSSYLGSIIAVIAFVPLGIIQAILFIKLLGLKDDLYGLLKPLAYSSIATGILIASILLMPVAYIPSIIAEVILGMIFFKATKDSKETQQIKS